MHRVFVILFLSFCVPLFAQQQIDSQTTTLHITKAGYFLVVFDSDDVPHVMQITNVVIKGTPNPNFPPEPNPEPTPPAPPVVVIPNDQFDNLGAKVKIGTDKLTSRKHAIAMGKLYRDAAKRLRGEVDPNLVFVTITDAANHVRVEREKIWGTDKPEWQAMLDSTIIPTWNKFWPMDKVKIAAFYDVAANVWEGYK